MKTKVIVAALLILAAASADARFAWLYPRKTGSPDETGHWIVINSSPSRQGAESGEKSSPSKEKIPHVAGKDFTFCEMSISERLR